MKKVAYLLPPKRRTVSRFINMSQWVMVVKNAVDL
jgi:hypothetical protein